MSDLQERIATEAHERLAIRRALRTEFPFFPQSVVSALQQDTDSLDRLLRYLRRLRDERTV